MQTLFFTLVLTVHAAFATPASWIGGGKPISDTEEKYRAVVRIRAQTWACSATFLSDTRLLTAAHCVGHDRDGGYVMLGDVRSERVVENPGFARLKDSPWVSDAAPYDFAIAIFPKGTGQGRGIREYKRLAAKSARVGDKVTMVGFGINDLPHEAGGGVKRWGTNTVRTAGRVIGLFGRSVPGDESGARAAGASGDSGGPLFDEQGEIVGITSYGDMKKRPDDHWIYYTNVLSPTNLRLLRELDPQATPADPTCLEDDESREWITLLVEQTKGALDAESAKRLAELTRRRDRYGRCDGM